MNAPLPYGFVDGMPFDEYLSIEAASKSLLADLADCPYVAWAWHINPDRPEMLPTAAMKAGTLAHTLVLEPHAFASRYVVRPDGLDGRTKEGKAWLQEVADLEVITADQMNTAESQADAVRSVAGQWFVEGVAERSVFWTDKQSGAYCKARPDWVVHHDGSMVMIDLKTSADVSPDGFSKSIARFGYHRQAAHYMAGYEAATGHRVSEFVLLAVSNAYPYICVPYVLDAESLQQGRDEVAELLSTYAECKRSGVWPTYGKGLQLVSLPVWAKRSAELEVSYVD